MTYFERLSNRISQTTRLCVGLDPHPQILESWGLAVNAHSAEIMSRFVVESLADRVAAFKPQSALFERFGPEGIAALSRVLKDIRDSGAIAILDVKRGDIGSTMDGYAHAYLGDDAPMRADAITLSPYCGFAALEPAFALAEKTNSGVYVLCRTSNPQGQLLQTSLQEGRTVAQQIIDATIEREKMQNPAAKFIGLVIGATHKNLDLDLSKFQGSILGPGIGAQGGSVAELSDTFGQAANQVLPSVSRSVLQAGYSRDALISAVDSYRVTPD